MVISGLDVGRAHRAESVHMSDGVCRDGEVCTAVAMINRTVADPAVRASPERVLLATLVNER
jgi:hypothetical protein